MLQALGYTFEVVTLPHEEIVDNSIAPQQVAASLALQKNEFYRKSVSQENCTLLTADTVVICDKQILGKPKNERHAAEMLHKLCDNVHEVVSGVCISSGEKSIDFSVSSKVTFGKYTSKDIEFYIQQYQPFDKAGAYGIQEWLGMVAVTQIEGSYYNIVGLPTAEVHTCLKHEFGF